MAPNMPALTRKVEMTEIRKMLFLKRRGLMIGSELRISNQKKMVSITTAMTNMRMTCHEFQSYCVPAHENPSSKGSAPATSVMAPR